ncbi:tetratricopeptide repeat protein 32 [Hyalella azteca]|uniref:Tetratricopeptide repeat protein 32 n=1 Tax=Hyalella azteca TaxID=294128 RepID=A0A8B7NWC5_HYAAZ|nr:tetratricopeptide repeat protein 32 [Hyalella azteca]
MDFDGKILGYMKCRRFQDAEKLILDQINTLEKNGSGSRKDLASAYNWLGLCRYRAVEFDEAQQHFNTAIQHDSACAQAYYNRGTVCYRMGKSDKAVADMEMAVHLEPHNEEFLLGLTSAKKLQKLSKNNQ